MKGGSGASRLASLSTLRTLIVSDIHANLTAFEAVLSDAGSFDRVWCLGDVVGYGPDPNECIALLRQQPGLRCIMGNHDAALMGYIDLRTFNDQAAKAVTIQSELLTQESRDFLELLDIMIEEGEISFAHGSPRDPIWEYVVSSRVALENFSAYQTRICLVGHSHIPSIFVENPLARPTILTPQNADRWRSDQRFILNPGSVGQPRDHNPKAAYVIWDDEEDTWLFKRVAYDVESVQARITALGIPSRHASRLSQGV